MRPLSAPFCTIGLAAAMWLDASAVRAEPPVRRGASPPSRAPVAFVTGASALLAGFLIGGTLIGTSDSGAAQENAGWLVMEAGFTLAPIVSHATVDAWGRALLFAAPPAAGLSATAAIFAGNPGTIEHGSIEVQRAIWSFYVAGLIASVAGVVDATSLGAARTGVAIAPMFGAGTAGLTMGAPL